MNTAKITEVPVVKQSKKAKVIDIHTRQENKEVIENGFQKGMKVVQPIRDRADIQAMKVILMEKSHRDAMIFTLGINIGLRISDLLKLKVSDLVGKTHVKLVETKTNKDKRQLINSKLQHEIVNYVTAMGLSHNDFMFPSRKGDKPVGRVQVYKTLNAAAAIVGLEEIGTHSLRKTMGYWHYKQYKDVALLQDIFNHSAPSVTLRYIGINADIKDATFENFFL